MTSLIQTVREWFVYVGRAVARTPAGIRDAMMGGVFPYLRLLIVSRNFHVAVAMVGFFVVAAHYTRFFDLFLATNFVMVPLEFLIFLIYMPGFLRGMITRPGEGSAELYLIMGIWLNWSADLVVRIWSLVWRYSGRPEWMIVSDVITFILYLRTISGVIHVTAPSTIEGVVPRSSWYVVAVAFAAGLVTMAMAQWIAMGRVMWFF